MSIPYVGFGNDQLNGEPKCKEGDMVECPHCNQQHPVEFATNCDTGQPSSLLAFYDCGDKSYLAAVAGRFVTGLKAACSGSIECPPPTT